MRTRMAGYKIERHELQLVRGGTQFVFNDTEYKIFMALKEKSPYPVDHKELQRVTRRTYSAVKTAICGIRDCCLLENLIIENVKNHGYRLMKVVPL